MGVAKPVHLSDGVSFEKAGDAEVAYRTILYRRPLKQRLDGADHQAIDVLYRDYCTVTDWKMPGKPIGYWADVNEGGTTSFYVEFDNGEKTDFSFLTAVRKIANKKS